MKTLFKAVITLPIRLYNPLENEYETTLISVDPFIPLTLEKIESCLLKHLNAKAFLKPDHSEQPAKGFLTLNKGKTHELWQVGQTFTPLDLIGKKLFLWPFSPQIFSKIEGSLQDFQAANPNISHIDFSRWENSSAAVKLMRLCHSNVSHFSDLKTTTLKSIQHSICSIS